MKINSYKKLKVFHFADAIAKQLNKKNLSCVIFGNFGAQNLGDEAILAGQLTELRKIPGINVVVVSKNPTDIKRLHKTASISLRNPLNILLNIFKSNFVIVGGGGIICKSDRGPLGIIYQLYTLIMYILVPKLLRKKVYAIGLGIYENSNPFILKASIMLLRTVDILTVRDFHSLNLLKKHNAKSQIYKDNSYLMKQHTKNDLLKNGFFKKHYKKYKYNVGLALMSPENKSEEDYLILELTQFINTQSTNVHYWFYSCDYQVGFKNDQDFAKKVIDILVHNSLISTNYSVVPRSLTPQQFFSSFALLDHMISMRLHSSIFSYRNNLNFIGITYDKKSDSFLESIGKIPVSLKKTKINLLINTI